MFSKDLEQTIGQCYKRAREARHAHRHALRNGEWVASAAA